MCSGHLGAVAGAQARNLGQSRVFSGASHCPDHITTLHGYSRAIWALSGALGHSREPVALETDEKAGRDCGETEVMRRK